MWSPEEKDCNRITIKNKRTVLGLFLARRRKKAGQPEKNPIAKKTL